MSISRRGLLAGGTAVLTLGQAPAQSAGPRIPIGIASRTFQWTTIEQAIDLAAALGFDAIEWSVRPGAHVTPETVARDLPRAVARTKAAGMAVPLISANILDADAGAQAILAAARDVGVPLCRGAAAYRWDAATDRFGQLDAVRRRVAGLAAMNRRLGTTLAFHTYSGAGMIGGNLWDLLTVLRDVDSREVGFNYDTGHGLARNGPGWADALAAAGDRVRAVSVKDFRWARGSRGWAPEWTPIGEGMVDLPATLDGLLAHEPRRPLISQVEHHGLLSGDVGKAHLDMPLDSFRAYLLRDLQQTRAALPGQSTANQSGRASS